MTRDQDLRTARMTLDTVSRKAADMLRDFDDHHLADLLDDAVSGLFAALTAPPRPDHAGGVERPGEASGCEPGSDGWLAAVSPAQAPDKAAEREGVEDTDLAAYWRKKWHALMGKYDALAALAPQPNATEAGRGVGAETEGYWVVRRIGPDSRSAVICAKLSGRLEGGTKDIAYLGERIDAAERLVAAHNLVLAATPTPPTPDSTAQGDGFPSKGAAAKDLAQRIAKRLHECGGCQISSGAEYGHITPDGIRLIAETIDAALTPSAPIAAPVRENGGWGVLDVMQAPPTPASDVPGEAQTTPDSTAQGDGTSQEDADRKERARRRIQALGAALSRRDWSETERAYEAIRDAHDRPKVYDAHPVPADREGGR